jgi:hypothetical protein
MPDPTVLQFAVVRQGIVGCVQAPPPAKPVEATVAVAVGLLTKVLRPAR